MLGLKCATDPAWARACMKSLGAMLVDHAHCEMKAASNALSLAARHSARGAKNGRFVLLLIELAREELEHFARVVRELDARGIPLGTPPVDDYAAELRRRASGEPGDPLVVRLLVCALIEARSCERFKLLLAEMDGHEMKSFYEELFEAEARHYRTFVDLAIEVAGDEKAALEKLDRLAEIEASVVSGLGPPTPVVHG